MNTGSPLCGRHCVSLLALVSVLITGGFRSLAKGSTNLASGITQVGSSASIPEIRSGQVRVQLLSDTLVRLEARGSRGFEDRLTFHVVDRNWPGVSYTTNFASGLLVITTSNYVVRVPQAATSLSGVRVESATGEVLYNHSGVLENSRWLPGPADTPQVWWFADTPRLVPPPWGLVPAPAGSDFPSTSGWDVGNDAPDVYVFVPGGDYRQLRRDYLRLTGPTEMVPLYALGACDSRWYNYSESTALQQIQDYRAHDMPLDVLVVDTGWRVGTSTGYQPNQSLFPDLPRFFQRAHEQYVQVLFNDHPEPVAATALDPAELNYRYGGLAGLLGQGLDAWWYDRNWNVSLIAPAANLRKEVWGMQLYRDITEHVNPLRRPLIMANVDGIDNGIRNRPPNVAAHRFPIQWTGDTGAGFDYLQRGIENAVYSGVHALNPYLSEDLGGHMNNPTIEQYIRWIQYGALSPVYRPHCTWGLARMPWTFGPEAEQVARRFVKMRYRMLPLFYAAAHENYETGEPLLRRLDLDYPQYEDARRDNQYLLGKNILVAPVFQSIIQTIPANWLSNTQGQAGLRAEYYANEELQGSPVLVRTDSQVDFNWSSGSPGSSVPADHFSARWSGFIQVPAIAGDILLLATIDDGLRIWIDDRLVLQSWAPNDSVTYEATEVLRAGRAYRLRIEYKEISYGAVVRLLWRAYKNPTAPRSVWIPPGTWQDAWSGELVAGPAIVTNQVSLQRTPLYARAGAIHAWAPEMASTRQQCWDPITVEVYPRVDETNSLTLYEDDTSTQEYKTGAFRQTTLAVWADNESNRISVAIGPGVGSFSNAPTERAWKVRLRRPMHWAADLVPDQAWVNGQPAGPILRFIRNDSAMPFGAPSGAPEADVYEVSLPTLPVTTSNLVEVVYGPAHRSRWLCDDLGGVRGEGSAVLSNGVYVVSGSGTGFSSSEDGGHLLRCPITGNVQMTARLIALSATHPQAEAGIMIRDGFEASARQFTIALTATNGLILQRRNVTNTLASTQSAPGLPLPCWLRLTRAGNLFSGWASSNGLAWIQIGSATMNGLGSNAFIGLAVASLANTNAAVALFDQVHVSTPVWISGVPDQSTLEGAATGPISFVVGSASVPAEHLTVNASSTNSILLPQSQIEIDGTGSNRTVRLLPTAGHTGASQVTLMVSDGHFNAITVFNLVVHPLPRLAVEPNLTTHSWRLFWPEYAGGMALQSATSLNPPILWQPVTNLPTHTNAQFLLENRVTNQTQFYRLIRP